jgi:hypothetical protein
MKSNRRIAWSLKAALLLAPFITGGCVIYLGDGECRNLPSEAKRTEELTAALTGITTVEVSTGIGVIRVEAGDVNEAVIEAGIKVRAKTDEEAQALLEGVRISAEASDQKLIIKAVKPSDFGHNSLIVDFTVRVPRQLEARCTTNVGDIHLTGLAGDVTARTDVGKIDGADLHGGKGDFTTNVGAITIAYADDAPVALRVDAGTNVGDIEFSGPEHLSAKFSAVTNVGGIHTSREMKVRGFVGKSLDATVDSGEGRVSFRTNVGSIHIR